MAESTALTTAPQQAMPDWMASIFGQLEAAMPVAKMLAGSELVPKCYRDRPADIIIAAAMGRRLGIDLFTALGGIAPINGRPQVWGDLVLAICQQNPEFQDHVETYDGKPYEDTFTAICTVTRKGRKPHTEMFTVADAKRAGKWDERAKVERKGQGGGTYTADNDSPWYRYPRRMLMARARGYALRFMFADSLSGMSIRELEDDLREVEAVVVSTEATPARTGLPGAAAPAATENGGPAQHGTEQPSGGAPTGSSASAGGQSPAAGSALRPPHPVFTASRDLHRAIGKARGNTALLERLCKIHGGTTPLDTPTANLDALAADIAKVQAVAANADQTLELIAKLEVDAQEAAREAAAGGGQ